MVAIATGSGLGLFNSSRAVLGAQGSVGSATLGQGKESIYVNAATGNLVIQQTDEMLFGSGLDLNLVRTYNSQGLLNDDNGDNWRLSTTALKNLPTGASLNAINSTLTRVSEDGAETVYTYDASFAAYVSRDGDGAHDTIKYAAGTLPWTYTNGSSRITEKYNATGQLVSTHDIDGNATTYIYTGALLTQINSLSQDPTGAITTPNQTTYIDYSGNNITQIRTLSDGLTGTRTRYTYDTSNRLTQVSVDLSPADNVVADGNTYVTTYTYDGISRRVASITQRDGTRVSFTYEQTGAYRITSVTDGLGNITTINYFSATQTNVVAMGLTTSYIYDSSKRLTEIRTPALTGGTYISTKYTYDTDSNVATVTDGRNTVTTHQYDINGNLVFSRDGLGNTVSRTYNAANQITSETRYTTPSTGVPGNPLTTRYVYDGENHLRFLISAEGRVTEYRYNTVGQRLSEIQYTGSSYNVAALKDRLASLDFDGVNDFVRIDADPGLGANPMTVQAWVNADDLLGGSNTWGGRGIIRSFTNDNGAAGDYYLSVDANGAVHFAYWQTPGNNLTGRVYSANNIITTGKWYHIVATWDGTNRRVFVNGVQLTTSTAATDVSWGVSRNIGRSFADSSSSFDGKIDDVRLYSGVLSASEITNLYGNDSASVTSSTLRARWTFDQTSDITATNTVSATLNGTLVNTTGQQSWRIGVTTDLTVTDLTSWLPTDKTKTLRTDYAYDFRGQVNKATLYNAINATTGEGIADTTNNSVTRYVYDQRGRLLQRVDPRGEVTTTIANDFTTTYTYDGLGRLLSTTDALGNITSNQYDAAQNRIVTTAANGVLITAIYDVRGLLTSQSQASAGITLGTTAYSYDGLGRLRMVTDPTGIKTFLYDEANRKVADIDGTGALTEYVYNANHQVWKTLRYANRLSAAQQSSLLANPTTATLAAMRPVADIDINDNNTADRITWQIYDSASRLLWSIESSDTSQTQGFATQYIYDGANRLTQTTRYDTAVATTGISITSTSLTAPTGTSRITRYFYDKDGKLQGSQDADNYLTELKYNAAGQLTETIRYNTAKIGTILVVARPAAHVDDLRTYNLYNTKGQLVGVLELGGAANGTVWNAEYYLTEYQYDVAGNVKQQTRYNDKSPITSYTGQSLSALRPTTNASKNQITLNTYTALNQLATVTQNPAGTVTRYSYDNMGRLTRTDAAFNTTDLRTSQTKYDVYGRVTAELAGEGSAALAALVNPLQLQIDNIWAQYGVSHSYDAAGRRTITTDQYGFKTFYYYDEANRLRFTIRQADNGSTLLNQGEITEREYDALGQRTFTRRYATRMSTTGLTGGVITTAFQTTVNGLRSTLNDRVEESRYTLRGAVKAAIDALGKTTSYTYNSFGEMLTQTRPVSISQSLLQTYNYNKRGQMISAYRDPANINAFELRAYDAFGRLKTLTDAHNKTTTFNYDRLGRQVSITDPLSNTRSVAYDAFSRVLTQTDALGNITAYAYDDTNRSVSITTPEGIKTTTVRNRTGDTVSVTDGKGNTTNYTYNKDGQLKTQTDALTNATTHNYDRAGREIETVDANGNRTTFAYDAASRLITRTVDPAGLNLITRYEYDALGNRIQQTDANGIITQTEYDVKGQVKAVVVDAAMTGLNLRTGYTYDDAGHTLTVTQGALTGDPRTTQYIYDALGRRTKEIVDPASLKLTTEYVYDKKDNVTLKIEAQGTTDERITSYIYDANDRQIMRVDPMGAVTETVYDKNGNVIKTIAYANAVKLKNVLDYSNTTSYTYNATTNQITAVTGTGGRSIKIDPAVLPATTAWYAYVFGTGLAFTATPLSNNDGTLQATNWQGELNIGVLPTTVAGTYLATAAIDSSSLNLVVTLDVPQIGTQNITRVLYQPDAAQIRQLLAEDSINDHVTRYTYDNDNRLSYSVDAVGAVTERTYDAAGNVVLTRAYATALTSTQLATLDAASNRFTTLRNSVDTSTNDRINRAAYDAANRQIFTLDGLGYVTEKVYDKAGNVVDTIRYANAVPRQDSVTIDNTTKYNYIAATNLFTAQVGTGRSIKLQPGAYVDSTPILVAVNIYTSTGTVNDITMALDTDSAQNWGGDVNIPTLAAGTYRVVTSVYDSFTTSRNTTFNITVDASGNIIRVQYVPTVAEIRKLQVANTTLDQHTKVVYDNANRARYQIDASNYVTENQYDAGGQLIKTTRYNDAIAATAITTTIANVQTALQARAAPVTANDQVTRFVYNKVGHLAFSIDAAGAVTKNSYDLVGNIIRTQAYATALTTTQLGLLDSAVNRLAYTISNAFVHNMDDRVTRYAYDKNNRLVYSVDALGAVTQQTFDAAGNVIQKREYPTALTTAQLDSLVNTSSATFIIDNSTTTLNRVTHYSYDKRGRVAFTIDPMLAATEQSYDAFGNVVQTKAYAKAIALNQTQIASTLAAATDRSAAMKAMVVVDNTYDRITKFVYNKDNQLTEETNFAGTKRYQYNAFGNVTDIIDPRGVELAEKDTDWAKTERVRLGLGYAQLVSGLNVTQQTALRELYTTHQEFDRNNRQIAQISASDGRTSTTYDAFGNIVKLTDANGNVGYFYYNNLNKVNIQIDTEGYATQYSYDAFANVKTTYKYVNWVRGLNGAQYAYSINTVPVYLTSAPTGTPPSAYILASEKDQLTTAQYDLRNRTTQITDAEMTNGKPNIENFTYDVLGNVKTHTDKNRYVTAYDYDANGNKTAEYSPVMEVLYRSQTAQLIETGTGTTGAPKIAFDSQGNALAVWRQHDGTRFNSWYNRYIAGSGPGAGWQTAQLIGISADTPTPEIAFDSQGNAMAVWGQFNANGSVSIWSNRYIAGSGVGTGWQTAQSIEPSNPGYSAAEPKIAFDRQGNALAVWQQYDGTRYNIWSNRYIAGSGAGTGWQTAVKIEFDDVSNAYTPQIAFDSQGNAQAVWLQSDGTRYNIGSNRYIAGTGWQTQNAQLLQTDNTGYTQSPKIAVDSQGNALVVWQQSDGTRDNIWSRRYIAGLGAGTGWQTAQTIETGTSGAGMPQIAFDSQGNALAVWLQSEGIRNNIWSNRYVAGLGTGTGWQTAQLVETDDWGTAAAAPQIAFDSHGNALVVWERYPHSNANVANTGIWSNRYIAGIGWQTAKIIETGDTGKVNTFSSQIAVDNQGNALVVWSQSDGTRYNIQSRWLPPAINTYTYNTFGELAQSIQAPGVPQQRLTEYVYDKNGRVTETIEPQVLTATGTSIGLLQTPHNYKTYDAAGNVITETTNAVSAADASTKGLISYHYYDASNRRIATIDAEKYLHVFAYDAMGNRISERTYASKVTAITFTTLPDINTMSGFVTTDYRETKYRYDAGNHVVEQSTRDVLVYERQKTANGYPNDVLFSTGNKSAYQVVNDSQGNVMAVWIETVGGYTNLYAQRYATGTGWEPQPTLLDSNNYSVNTATVAMDKQGNVMVVWNQYNGAWSNYVRGFNVSTGWDATVTLLENNNYAAQTPSVVFDGQGNALAAWRQKSSTSLTGDNVYTRRYTPAGGWKELDPPISVESLNGDTSILSLAMSEQGEAVLLFTKAITATNGTVTYTTYIARSTDGGQTWNTPTSLGSGIYPSISFDYQGNGLMLWVLNGVIYSERYIAGQGLSSSSTQQIGTGAVVSFEFDAQGNAFALIRTLDNNLTALRYIVNQGWDAQGSVSLNTISSTSFSVPSLAFDSLGNAIAVWQQPDGRIYSKQYLAGFGWQTTQMVETSGGTATQPQLTIDAQGNALLSWAITNGSSKNYYSRLIKPKITGLGWLVNGERGLRNQSLTTTYTYDRTGNVVKATDARGANTYMYYDKIGNRTLQVDALGYVTKWDYDASGNALTETRFAKAISLTGITTTTKPAEPTPDNVTPNRVTTYAYDRMNRRLTETVNNVVTTTVTTGTGNTDTGAPVETTNNVTTEYRYDAMGNRTVKIEGEKAIGVTTTETSQTDYTYDALNRLTREQGATFTDFQGTSVRTTTETQYDAVGNVIAVTNKGKTSDQDQTTRYTYDAHGNRTQETDALGNPILYFYDLNGNVKKRTLQHTNADAVPVISTSNSTYEYNKLNQQTTTLDDEGIYHTATYNAYGEVIAKGNAVLTGLERFEYDYAGRLVKTNKDDGVWRAYLYDANGNETAKIQSSDKNLNGIAVNPTTAGVDLSAMPVDYVANISASIVQRTESEYDARNQLINTYQAPINNLNETLGAGTEQWVGAINDPFIGGTLSLSESSNLNYGVDIVLDRYDPFVYDAIFYTYMSWQPLTGYGEGRYHFVWTQTIGGVVSVTDVYAAADSTSVTGRTVKRIGFLNNIYSYTHTVKLYKETLYGDVFIQDISTFSMAGGIMDSIDGAEAYMYSGPQRSGSVVIDNKSLHFTGQKAEAQYMDLKLTTTNAGVTESFTYTNIARLINTGGTSINGWFVFDWSVLAIPAGESRVYKYEFWTKTNNAIVNEAIDGNVLEHVKGDLTLGTNLAIISKDVFTTGYNLSGAGVVVNTIARSQTFNAFGEIESEIDSRGNAAIAGATQQQKDDLRKKYSTTFVYNTRGQLVDKLDPLVDATNNFGTINQNIRPATHYYYNLLGQTVGERTLNSNYSTSDVFTNLDYNYSTQSLDAAGHVMRVYQGGALTGAGSAVATDLVLGIKKYRYDVFGNMRYQYDELDTTSSALNRTTYIYDKKNQVVRIYRPTGAGFYRTDIDINGSISGGMVTDASGAIISSTNQAARYDYYVYDEAGNRISHTNALGLTEKTYYDKIGRVTKTVSFGGIATLYNYSSEIANGYTTITTAPSGGSKTLVDVKDYFGRLLTHTDAGMHVFNYTYNRAGWLTQQTGDTNLTVAGNEQNITFSYYHNGLLKQTDDTGVHTKTRYEYDANGNRTLEAYYQEGGVYYQWSQVTYDALNRVTNITDSKYDVTYEYDAAGNRRHVYANYHDGVTGSNAKQDYWYTYDTFNRFTITKGALSYTDSVGNVRIWNRGSSSIAIDSTTGYEIAYNKDSTRKTSTYYLSNGKKAQEEYVYAKDGMLRLVKIDNDLSDAVVSVKSATREYDAAGNVLRYTEYDATGTTPTRTQTTRYFNNNKEKYYDGKVFEDKTLVNHLTDDKKDSNTTSTYTYNTDGSLAKVATSQIADGQTTTYDLQYTYEYWDSAKQKTIKKYARNSNVDGVWQPGFSNFEYDVNGHLTKVNDEGSDIKRYLRYKLDSDGRILQRNELIGAASSRTQNYYYLNGIGVGDAGSFAPNGSTLDYTSMLAGRDVKPEKYAKPVSSADFDYNFQPINDQYPATTPGAFTVPQAGMTLQNVALSVWGDSTLWYLLADANGINESTQLVEGQVLVIPNVVTNIHNNSSTFQVYNPGELIGDTSPTLPNPPPPPKPSCAKQILVMVVVIVVSAYLGPMIGQMLMQAGTAAAVGLGATVGGIAATTAGVIGYGIGAGLGAALGNLAGQETARGLGMIDHVDMGSVRDTFKTNALTSLLLGPAGDADGYLKSMGNAAGRATVNEYVSSKVLEGYKFDWHNVSAAAIAAPVAFGFGKLVGGKDFGANLMRGLVGSAANSYASSYTHNYERQYKPTAASIFGNALGGAIGSQIAPPEIARPGLLDMMGVSGAASSMFKGAMNWIGTSIGGMFGSDDSDESRGIGSINIGWNPSSAELGAALSISGTTDLSSSSESMAANAPAKHTVRSGENLSRILGTSDPAAIGAFMRANGLTNSTIYPGQELTLPAGGYSRDDQALGQGALNTDNARLAERLAPVSVEPVAGVVYGPMRGGYGAASAPEPAGTLLGRDGSRQYVYQTPSSGMEGYQFVPTGVTPLSDYMYTPGSGKLLAGGLAALYGAPLLSAFAGTTFGSVALPATGLGLDAYAVSTWTPQLGELPPIVGFYSAGSSIAGRVEGGVANTTERSLKLPATDSSLSGTGTLGYTLPNGDVFLQPGLSRAEQVITLRHEGVHAFLSVPDGAPLAAARQSLGMWGYNNSTLLRWGEEGLAQGIATRSITEGLRFAVVNPYGVSLPQLGAESLIVGGGLAGIWYGAYQLGKGD